MKHWLNNWEKYLSKFLTLHGVKLAKVRNKRVAVGQHYISSFEALLTIAAI